MKREIIAVFIVAIFLILISPFVSAEKIVGWDTEIKPVVTGLTISGYDNKIRIFVTLEGVGQFTFHSSINGIQDTMTILGCGWWENKTDICRLTILCSERERPCSLKEGENEIILFTEDLTFEAGKPVGRNLFNEAGQKYDTKCGPNLGIKIKFNLVEIPAEWEPKITSVKSTEEGITITNVTFISGEIYPGAKERRLHLEGLENGKEYSIYLNDVLVSPSVPRYFGPGTEHWILLPESEINYDNTNTISFKDKDGKGAIINFNVSATSDKKTFRVASVNYPGEIIESYHFHTYQEFVEIGGYVRIRGRNFPKNNMYTLYFNDQKIKEIKSDERGVINDVFKITRELNPITYTLNYTEVHHKMMYKIVDSITGQNFITLKQGEKIISKQIFEVAKEIEGVSDIVKNMYNAKVFPIPRIGEYGDKVDIHAGGLTPGESYKIEIGSVCEVPIPGICKKIEFVADKNGEFTAKDITMANPPIGAIVTWLISFFKTPPSGKKEIRNIEDDIKRLKESISILIKLSILTGPKSIPVTGDNFIIISKVREKSEKYNIPLCEIHY